MKASLRIYTAAICNRQLKQLFDEGKIENVFTRAVVRIVRSPPAGAPGTFYFSALQAFMTFIFLIARFLSQRNRAKIPLPLCRNS